VDVLRGEPAAAGATRVRVIDALGQDAALAARALLGATLTRTLDSGEVLSGVIVETEAYTGPEDQCSHARNGRRTARNEHMWSAPGTAYVYFTYGMHWCFNVSCYQRDHPAAVLIRALRPVEGLETMRGLRLASSSKTTMKDTDLCSGPAKLCRALGISGEDSGVDLLTSRTLTLGAGDAVPDAWVQNTPRIGVGSGEWADKPLRWVVKPDRMGSV
jgi:DNA-3-methyladenine glycosylase